MSRNRMPPTIQTFLFSVAIWCSICLAVDVPHNVPPPRSPPWESPGQSAFSPQQILRALDRAKEAMRQRNEQEFALWSKNGGVDPQSHLGLAAAFNKPTIDALARANTSHFYEIASVELLKLHNNRVRRQLAGDLQDFGAAIDDNGLGTGFLPTGPQTPVLGLATPGIGADFIDSIPPPTTLQRCGLTEPGPAGCDPTSPFRSFSGICNNLRRPALGRSLTPFSRLLPANYENGVSHPRTTSSSGSSLPSPRRVSAMVHSDVSRLHGRFSLMMMQYAQFLDHDISFTPVHRGFFVSIPDCRDCDSARLVHPECMPIPIPPGDPYYPPINGSTGRPFCFSFMRSLPGQLAIGPREQVNQNSAFLDASHIYGEFVCRGAGLRGPSGRLNVTLMPPLTAGSPPRQLLPMTNTNPECRSPNGFCFYAGDGRASEQPGLTVLHTLFLREHNRVADALRQLNPRWSDEAVYQHGRRIVTAQTQHITFSEFLPRVLGWDAIRKYNLGLRTDGYHTGYDATCDPSIMNEFATAAFRFGHSLLRPHLPRAGPRWEPLNPPLLLRDAFFDPSVLLSPRALDELTRGLLAAPMEDMDRFITGEVTNHLFEQRRAPHTGMDLAALNIQRGRDHALQPYNEYRALCGLQRASTWEELQRELSAEAIDRLRQVYESVDDVELFPGGMSETPVRGGLVGPTFACIIALQFRQLRDCDRFWYETNSANERFSPQQLTEIRKTSLSRIICNNMDLSSDIQRAALDQPSGFLNPRVSCRTLQQIDLTAWTDPAAQGPPLAPAPQIAAPGASCQVAGRNIPVGASALATPCTSCTCTPTGLRCRSLRVSDCGRLIRGVGPDAVRRDDVCMAQCGAVLFSGGPPTPPQGPPQGPPQTGRGVPPDDGILLGLRPPPRRNLRPPPPPPPPSRGPLFNLARLLG